MQVGAADGADGDADNRIARLFDARLGHVFEPNVADIVEYNGFHCSSFHTRSRGWPDEVELF
jgi:hypothetical protein